jgi:hypothetical protein
MKFSHALKMAAHVEKGVNVNSRKHCKANNYLQSLMGDTIEALMQSPGT